MIENPLDFRFAVAPWYVFNFSELRSQLLLYDLRIFVCMYAFRPVSIFFQFGKLPLIEVCTLVCSTVITPYFFTSIYSVPIVLKVINSFLITIIQSVGNLAAIN